MNPSEGAEKDDRLPPDPPFLVVAVFRARPKLLGPAGVGVSGVLICEGESTSSFECCTMPKTPRREDLGADAAIP